MRLSQGLYPVSDMVQSDAAPIPKEHQDENQRAHNQRPQVRQIVFQSENLMPRMCPHSIRITRVISMTPTTGCLMRLCASAIRPRIRSTNHCRLATRTPIGAIRTIRCVVYNRPTARPGVCATTRRGTIRRTILTIRRVVCRRRIIITAAITATTIVRGWRTPRRPVPVPIWTRRMLTA